MLDGLLFATIDIAYIASSPAAHLGSRSAIRQATYYIHTTTLVSSGHGLLLTPSYKATTTLTEVAVALLLLSMNTITRGVVNPTPPLPAWNR